MDKQAYLQGFIGTMVKRGARGAQVLRYLQRAGIDDLVNMSKHTDGLRTVDVATANTGLGNARDSLASLIKKLRANPEAPSLLKRLDTAQTAAWGPGDAAFDALIDTKALASKLRGMGINP